MQWTKMENISVFFTAYMTLKSVNDRFWIHIPHHIMYLYLANTVYRLSIHVYYSSDVS